MPLCACVWHAKEIDASLVWGKKENREGRTEGSWRRGKERVRYTEKEREREVENKVEWLPACTCGSLTTVTHTNRNIPNKLQAFRVWQADIFSEQFHIYGTKSRGCRTKLHHTEMPED